MAISDREQWRQRILKALSELKSDGTATSYAGSRRSVQDEDSQAPQVQDPRA
jgi:hypothetical protein